MASECSGIIVSGKKKRTRKSLTLNAKLEMIKLSEQGLSMTEIGRTLGMPRNTVSTIVSRKETVLKEVESATPFNTKYKRRRGSLIGDMEKHLLVWIEDQCKNNVPLTQTTIQDKALSLFSAMKAERNEGASDDTFKASKGWFSRFKERSLLHNIKVLAETPTSDAAAAERCQYRLSEVIRDGGYSEQQIFCVHETALYWRKLPGDTSSAKEKSKSAAQAAKDKFTLLLGANAAGNLKLKPVLIYHQKNPTALQNYIKSTLPVYYKYSFKALMTANIFAEWFTNYFKPTVEAYCKEQNIPFKILLVANSDPSYPKSLIDLYKEIRVVYLPANSAKLLQPMDQGVIAEFRVYYLKNIFLKVINAIKRDAQNCDASNNDVLNHNAVNSDAQAKHSYNVLKEIVEGFSILDGVKAVRDAWEEVTQTTLKVAWKHLIPSMVDYEGFENPLETATLHVVGIAKEADLKLEFEDVEELVASHDEAFTESLLLDEQKFILCEDTLNSDDIPAVPREMTTKELEEAVNYVEMGMSAFQSIDPDVRRSSRVNAVLLESIACYKDILRERKRQNTTHCSLLSYFAKLPLQPSTAAEDLASQAMDDSSKTLSKSSSAKRMRNDEEADDKSVLSFSSFSE